MKLRHLATAPLLALATFACTPSVPSNPNTVVVTAQFDPATNTIPLPNDLAINPLLNPGIVPPQANAQNELLGYFHAQGGFPPDQVLPLSFPVTTETVNGPGDVAFSAPDIDTGTIVKCTGQQAPGNCNFFLFDAAAPAGEEFPSYVVTYPQPLLGAPGGSLVATPVTADGKPTTWRPGALFFYALRGGANGIKTKGGAALHPSPTTFTLVFGGPSDFTCPSTVPPAQCPLATLKLLQAQYLPVFAAIENKGFPLDDTAVVGTFAVAKATTWVIADPTSGVVPVPSNFLLDPGTNGKVSAAAAAAFKIPALASLDGFSTTGMDVAQTYSWSVAAGASVSSPILATTVRSSAGQGVYLYKVGATTATQVNTVYIEPPPITIDPSTGKPCVPVNAQGDFGANCVSTVIGIQPALTLPTAAGPVALPPLAEKTDYAIIVTNVIKDVNGKGLSNTTLGQMLLFENPICLPSPGCAADPATSTSAIAGVSAKDASMLEGMRLKLKPAVVQVATDHGVLKSAITMPYVFRTQSITQEALLLGAGPYQKLPSGEDAFPKAPVAASAVTPAAMALKWGVDPALLAGISTFVEASVVTFDKLDPTTGAFNPVPAAGALVPLPTLIALPTGTPPPGGWPLVVFHHGLGRSRGDLLFIAQALAGNGMAVAAIDAAKHGARAWCKVDTTTIPTPVATGCSGTAVCDTTVFAQQQGDLATAKPGLCKDNALRLLPIGCIPSATNPCWDGTGGTSQTSGEFAVSANLFRTRDTIRQDILDQSMLVRVLTTPEGNEVIRAAAGLAAATVPLNAGKVYYVGQSWGSIEGTIDLASNPRFSRAVLNVGGATLVDILTTATSFEELYANLLAQLGVVPGTPEYLLFMIGAKWILDPADPANYAGHVVLAPLPNLLADPTGQTPMAAKSVLGQGARCDATVPNAANELLYGLIGLAPLGPTASSATPGMQWFMNSTGGTCPTDGSVGPGATHGFLLDWTKPSLAAAGQASVVSYLLGGPVAPTPVVVP